MCFAVVAGVARYAAEAGIDTPIEFIFDEQEGVDDDIRTFFSHLKKGLPVQAQNLIDGVPFFKNDRDKRYMPLQAADLLAWHVRREHETGKALPRTRDLLNDSGHLTQQIPDRVVRAWARHHAALPGTPLIQSKGQWRQAKKEIKRLIARGIDPSKISGPGVYYPEGTPWLARSLDKVMRLFQGWRSARRNRP